MITVPSDRTAGDPKRGGFSLVEVIIALSLGMMVAAAMLSSLIFMLGSSLSVKNYIDMNSETRTALEILGRDLRNTVDVEEGFSKSEFQVQVLQQDDSLEHVTYSYRDNGQNGSLVRTDSNDEKILVHNVDQLDFLYYNLQAEAVQEYPLSVTQVQIQMTTAREERGIDNTDRVISARFILRNKYVTN